MAHEWDRGVLAKSSWHGLEEVGIMADAAAQIAAGERTGAWPVALSQVELRTAEGFLAPCKGILANYAQHDPRVLGVVGDRYRETKCEEWRNLLYAAVAAGGRPTGAFSLRDGSRVLATLEVGTANGLRTNLLLADAFDGSMRFTCGFTTIDVVCANTLAMSLGQDGDGMAQIRHTVSAEQKIETLRQTIGAAIASGSKVRDLYKSARAARLDKSTAMKVFDALFPEAPKDATPRTKSIADAARDEAAQAMALPINHRGEPGTLATLWNTATWLVDRDANGNARKVRGDGNPLESLLWGSKGGRVQEIQTIVEVLMRDGTVKHVQASEALELGVDARTVGKTVLDDMLGEVPN